jgi:hypothetical protein
MARQNKGSRSKYLPPKIQLQIKDATTGSYPAKFRTSVDGRTGRYNVNFDDTKTVNFVSQQVQIIRGTRAGTNGVGFDANETYSDIGYSPGSDLILWLRFEETVSLLTNEDVLIDGCNTDINTSVTGGLHPFNFFRNEGSASLSSDVPSFYISGDTVQNKFSLALNTKPRFVGDTTRYEPTNIKYDSDQSAFQFYGNKSWTFACHIKFDSLIGYYTSAGNEGTVNIVPIFSVGSDGGSGVASYQAWVDNVGNVYVGLYQNLLETPSYIIFRTINKPLGDTPTSWHHIAIVVDSTVPAATFYVDGAVCTSTIAETTSPSWTDYDSSAAGIMHLGVVHDNGYLGPHYLGTTQFTSFDTFYGSFKIDNLIMFSRLLTSPEVNVLKYGGPLSDYVPSIQADDIRNGGIILPLGLSQGHSLIQESTELSTSIGAVSGVIRKGVADAFIHFTPGQDLQPFRDNARPSSDGKGMSSNFYATGSAVDIVGEGFNQPLWSKTKIEIDLTPAASHSFFIHSASNNNIMAYWNKNTKMYEGIGPGTGFANYNGITSGALKRFLDEVPIGFGASLDNGSFTTGLISSSYILSTPISNFGFPMHAKFAGTSSNLISMSDYISEPFLLEKIVIYFSGALNLNDYYQSFPLACITSMFILNQRGPYALDSDQANQTISFYSGSSNPVQTLVTGVNLPTTYNGKYVNTVRDLITWVQISQDNSGAPDLYSQGLQREVSTDGLPNWSMQLMISSSVKSPLQLPSGLPILISGSGAGSAFYAPEYIEKFNFAGRKGIPQANGRDFINSFSSFEVAGTASLFTSRAAFLSFNVANKISKTNPYYLMPEDNLIIGWQLPYSRDGFGARSLGTPVYNGKGPELSISPNGIHKIVMYGSHLREGKEYHDTTNQLLTSQTVHEVIG